jgi:hypothetical protein
VGIGQFRGISAALSMCHPSSPCPAFMACTC